MTHAAFHLPSPTVNPTNAVSVLVVDDEPDIVALVAFHLLKAGYRVGTASTGQDALDQARRDRPSLVVLDLMLPGMSGFDVLEQLRADEATRGVAVLMLTARREEPDRIRGLSLGADDYLTKPFDFPELCARLRALARRPADALPAVLQVGELRLDAASRQVWVGTSIVPLTLKEFSVLDLLLRHAGRVVTRSDLMESAWDAHYDGLSNVLDVCIAGLRRKLDDHAGSPPIETVRGVGYRLVVPEAGA